MGMLPQYEVIDIDPTSVNLDDLLNEEISPYQRIAAVLDLRPGPFRVILEARD